MVEKWCVFFDFLGDFMCDGSICHSRCCREWRIDIDPQTLKKYKKLKDKSLRKDIKDNISYIKQKKGYAFTLTKDNKCPFLQGDFLCRIQKQMGESYISDICATYPRVYKDFGTYMSESLTLSCPVAVLNLLKQEKPLHLLRNKKSPKRKAMVLVPLLKGAIIDNLMSIQNAGIALLQNQRLTMRQRWLNLLMFGEGLDKLFLQADQDITEYIKIFLDRGQMEIGKLADGLDFLGNKYIVEFFAMLDRVMIARNVIINEREKAYERMFWEYYHLAESTTVGELLALYQEANNAWRIYVMGKYPQFWENYLVYQFFSTTQPIFLNGGIKHNLQVFLISVRIQQMLLAAVAAQKKDKLQKNDIVGCVSFLVKQLEHDHSACNALGDYVKESKFETMDFLKIWLPENR